MCLQVMLNYLRAEGLDPANVLSQLSLCKFTAVA